MAESLNVRLAKTGLDTMSERELRAFLASLLDGLQAVMAKLDSDAGVTATDFAATLATYVTD